MLVKIALLLLYLILLINSSTQEQENVNNDEVSEFQKIGELISPVIVNHISRRSINIILEGFGMKFHLMVQPINYTFLLSDGSDNNKLKCFYNGIVNDDIATSRVYINLCKPDKMIGGFHYNFTEYFIEPYEDKGMNDGNLIYHYYLKDKNQIVNLNSSFINKNFKNENNNENFKKYEKHLLYKLNDMRSEHRQNQQEIFDDDDQNKKLNKDVKPTFASSDEEEEEKQEGNDEEIQEEKNVLNNNNSINSSRLVKRNHELDNNFDAYISAIEESQVKIVYLELLVVVDSKMSEFYGSRLTDYIHTLLFITTEIFKHPTMNNLINIIISDIFYLHDVERNRSKYSSIKTLPKITWNAASTLDSFCEWQAKYRKILYDEKMIQIDAAILITKEDICKDTSCHTLGMAKMGQLCDVVDSCAIVEDNGLGTPYSIAHEIGHILHMQHTSSPLCGKYQAKEKIPDDSFTYIMESVLDLKKDSYKWSKCSIKTLIQTLKKDSASCFFNKPQIDRSFYNQKYVNQIMKTLDESFRFVLPGERYSLDDQCRQKRGKDSISCATGPICENVWCRIRINTTFGEVDACQSTSSKAADGTPCSTNKFCISGKCVTKSSHQLVRQDGGWSKWTDWTDCSRTCGGGVSLSIRTCNNPRPAHGGLMCEGERIRYQSCNTENCGYQAIEFRDLQCRRGPLNDNVVRTIKNQGYNAARTWASFYHEIEKCKLWCIPLYGETNIVSFGLDVVDGTKCDRYSYDICVNGNCHKAGCDNVLGSDTKYDNCNVCGGDNSTCRFVKKRVSVAMYYEYQYIFEIPPHATNIKIRRYRDHEIKAMTNGSDGYIAAKSGNSALFNIGWFVLSGTKKGIAVAGGGLLDYIIDNPNEELIISRGRTEEKIDFFYLGVNLDREKIKDTTIEYSYYESLKEPIVSNTLISTQNNINKLNIDLSQSAHWSHDDTLTKETGFCDKECEGVMLIKPACVSDKTNEVVDDKLCKSKPQKQKYVPCNTHCKYTAIDLTEKCLITNGTCGVGIRLYKIKCLRQDTTDFNMVAEVDASNCQMHTFIQSLKKDCYVPCEKYEWEMNEGECKPKCGNGIRIMSYVCMDTSAKQKVSNEFCNKLQKHADYVESCSTNCYSWKEGEWSTCSKSCGFGQKTRTLSCYYENQKVLENYCYHVPKPVTKQECDSGPCDIKWKEGPWSECSAKCGRGEKKRTVVCTYNGKVVDLRYCEHHLKPIETEACDSGFCSQWKTTEWDSCSIKCGVGIRTRNVFCENREKIVHESNCDATIKPTPTTECKGINCAEWKTDNWSQCSVTCGDGFQKRNVFCSNILTNDLQGCLPNEKPADQRTCQLAACPKLVWKLGDFSSCSMSCGWGWRTRSVTCSDTNGRIVENKMCSQPEPPYFTNCRVAYCGDWNIGNWSQCSATCGLGTQMRTVSCYIMNKPVDETQCDVTIKPIHTQNCIVNCPSKRKSDWKILSRSGCSKTCGGGWIVVKSECQFEDGSISTQCDETKMPLSNIRCNEEECPIWNSGQWSQCSTTCGSGVQTRIVSCKMYNGTITNDINCNFEEKPYEKQTCMNTVCPKWSTTSWSTCNLNECIQNRDVKCIQENGLVMNNDYCDKSKKPHSKKQCDDINECDIYKSKLTDPMNILGKPLKINGKVVRIHHTPWSKCTSICNSIPGIETRTSICRLLNFTEVPLDICDLKDKVESRPCTSNKTCSFKLYEQPGECKGSCGTNGTREVDFSCRETTTQRHMDLSFCGINHESNRVQACSVSACTTTIKSLQNFEWKTDAWSRCAGGCGFANKTRVVFCWYNSKNYSVKDSYCSKLQKPVVQTPCIDPACGYGWFVSEWSRCSKTCSNGMKTRKVSCVKLSPEGHVLNETSNKCKLVNKPISTMECNYGECSSSHVWKPSSWSQCSSACGFGYQRRNITCIKINGIEDDSNKCERNNSPMKYQICYNNCYAPSCLQLRLIFGIYRDGDYSLNISSKIVKIYCKNMNSSKPLEYITLKSELENYSEIYDKKLINSESCNPRWGPRYNIKCDACSNDTVSGYGTTAFSKIRIDIKSLKIISDDFTFSTPRYGSPVPFGIAGDCYSKNPECIQGSMHINLSGTNFSFAKNVSWKEYGQNAVNRIFITSDFNKAYGVCGGYCGGCKPDPKIGLQLRVTD